MREIEAYLESSHVKGLAPSSQATYRFALDRFKSYADVEGIKTLSPDIVNYMDGFAQYLESSRLSGKTIQQYINAIKIMMSYLNMPIEYTYRLKSKEKKKQKTKRLNRWLTEADVERCLDYRFPSNHTRNHLLIRVLVETGARVQEVSDIKVENVDIDNRTIFIDDSKTTPRYVFFSP